MTRPIASPTSYVFHRNESVAQGIGRILELWAGEASLLARPSRENSSDKVHDLRVLIKRLRALLWFAAPAISSVEARRAKSQLRKASHLLAAQRDAVVTRSTLQALSQKTSNTGYRERLLEIASNSKEAESAVKTFALAFKEASSIVLDTINDITSLIKGVSLWPEHSDRLSRAFRATNKAGKKALKSDGSARFHTWRTKAKRFFYLLQMTQVTPGKRMARIVEKVDDLQDKLGEYHDCVVAQNHLIKSVTGEATSSLIRHNVNLLEKKKNRLKETARTLARQIKQRIEIIHMVAEI